MAQVNAPVRVQNTYRASVLSAVHDHAVRLSEMRAIPLAEAVASGYTPRRHDIERFSHARDCASIAYMMWHLEIYGAFPSYWRIDEAQS